MASIDLAVGAGSGATVALSPKGGAREQSATERQGQVQRMRRRDLEIFWQLSVFVERFCSNRTDQSRSWHRKHSTRLSRDRSVHRPSRDRYWATDQNRLDRWRCLTSAKQVWRAGWQERSLHDLLHVCPLSFNARRQLLSGSYPEAACEGVRRGQSE